MGRGTGTGIDGGEGGETTGGEGGETTTESLNGTNRSNLSYCMSV